MEFAIVSKPRFRIGHAEPQNVQDRSKIEYNNKHQKRRDDHPAGWICLEKYGQLRNDAPEARVLGRGPPYFLADGLKEGVYGITAIFAPPDRIVIDDIVDIHRRGDGIRFLIPRESG